ncbi:MAG: hypothetical protein AAGD25_35430 [Cyanobacteria bacterium P01_F01_bin.150]
MSTSASAGNRIAVILHSVSEIERLLTAKCDRQRHGSRQTRILAYPGRIEFIHYRVAIVFWVAKSP